MRRKPLIVVALSLALSLGSLGFGVQLAMGQLARVRISAKPRAGVRTPISVPALPGQALGASGNTLPSLQHVLHPLAQGPQVLIQPLQTTHRAPEAASPLAELRPQIAHRGQDGIGLSSLNGVAPARQVLLRKTPGADSPSAALSPGPSLPPALRASLRRISTLASGSLGADAVFDGSGARDLQAPALPAGRARRSLAPSPENRLIKFDIDGVQLRLFRWALEQKLPDGAWLLPNYRILASPEHGGAISWGGVTHPVGVTLPGWAIENTGTQSEHGANEYSSDPTHYNRNLPNIITYVLNLFPDAMVEAYAAYRPIVRHIWNVQTILRNVGHSLLPNQVRRHTMRSTDPKDLSAEGDQRIVQAFINAIRKRDPQLLIAVLDGTDAVGHAYGSDSFEYLQALVQRDYDLGRVLQAVVKSGRAGEYSIMSGPDHGFEPERKTGDPLYGDSSVSKGFHGVNPVLLPEGKQPVSADSLAIFRIVNVPEGVTILARINVLDSMAIALKILLRKQGLSLPRRLQKNLDALSGADKVAFGDRPIPGRFSGIVTGDKHPLFRLREAYPALNYPAGKETLADLPPIFQTRAQ